MLGRSKEGHKSSWRAQWLEQGRGCAVIRYRTNTTQASTSTPAAGALRPNKTRHSFAHLKRGSGPSIAVVILLHVARSKLLPTEAPALM
jgi:hypothetical protein